MSLMACPVFLPNMPRTKFPTTFIYGLVDPITNQLRYVGKSDFPDDRFYNHLFDNSRTHKNNWIGKLLKARKRPVLIILEEVPYIDWQEAEQWWISYFRFLGANLTNGTKGGDGFTGVRSAEFRLKMSAIAKGRKFSDETRRKLSEAGKRRVFTEETKRKLSMPRRKRSVQKQSKEKRKTPEDLQSQSDLWFFENCVKEVFIDVRPE